MRSLRSANRVFAAIVLLAAAMPAAADIATRSTLQIYVTRGDRPFEGPVDLTVVCRGRMHWPGRSNQAPDTPAKLVEVYRYSVKCPSYGCEVHHNIYLANRQIASCEASGTAAGRPFRVRDIGSSPVGTCDRPSSESKFGQRCTLRLALPK